MSNYYFLGTILPELRIGEPLEITFKEFNQLLYDNLSASDYAKSETLRNFYGLYNLLAHWKGITLDPVGNLSESDLEEALVTRSVLPPYVFEYIDKYESPQERLRHFPELLSTFFKKEISRASGAFKTYLIIERDLRLILLAFRAKKLGRDPIPELQYEDPEDEIVAQIIAQKDSHNYEPPEKYEELKPLFEKYYNEPLELQKALAEYRFQKLDELIGLDLFSLDRILAYMVKLIIAEKWQHLDKQKGLEVVDSMLREPS